MAVLKNQNSERKTDLQSIFKKKKDWEIYIFD